MRVWAELSGENPALAVAEVEAATLARQGTALGAPERIDPERFVALDVPGAPSVPALASVLALTRRLLRPLGEGSRAEVAALAATEGRIGDRASFRVLDHGTEGEPVRWAAELGAAYVAGGGSIDLDRPTRRYGIVRSGKDSAYLLRELAEVDRAPFARRAMPRLPFRRPVSLAPRLARAATNLAGVRPKSVVADPFAGTGALLMEAGLMGGEIHGADIDPTMVRGALANLASVGVVPASLTVGDSGAISEEVPEVLDAVVTDPPYGRASTSRGEPPADLVARVLPPWAQRLAPGGRLVVILPGGPDPVPEPFHRVLSVRERVHRSLTREFRVYARHGEERRVSRP